MRSQGNKEKEAETDAKVREFEEEQRKLHAKVNAQRKKIAELREKRSELQAQEAQQAQELHEYQQALINQQKQNDRQVAWLKHMHTEDLQQQEESARQEEEARVQENLQEVKMLQEELAMQRQMLEQQAQHPTPPQTPPPEFATAGQRIIPTPHTMFFKQPADVRMPAYGEEKRPSQGHTQMTPETWSKSK